MGNCLPCSFEWLKERLEHSYLHTKGWGFSGNWAGWVYTALRNPSCQKRTNEVKAIPLSYNRTDIHWHLQRTKKPNFYCCCCCWIASVVSNSVWPHRRQPTRLPRPWDSPGKSTGVGCHFLLQCTKVKSECEVTQSLQPTRLLRPWDFPGKSTGVGCHCLLRVFTAGLTNSFSHHLQKRTKTLIT